MSLHPGFRVLDELELGLLHKISNQTIALIVAILNFYTLPSFGIHRRYGEGPW